MISLRGLKKVYRSSDVETSALDNINIDIAKGEFIAIMGPSGCGKSTLLNILGMLDTPTEGCYHFLEEDISHYSEQLLAKKRKAHIGFVFQSFNLIDELTVAENIEMPLLYQKVTKKERKQRVTEVMEQVDIGHRANHLPQQLSGGQQQRVAVARAIVTRPDVILADEPTGNLDSKHGDEVMDLLSQLNQQGTTVLMVTHSQYHAEYASRIIHLFDGKVVSENVVSENVVATEVEHAS